MEAILARPRLPDDLLAELHEALSQRLQDGSDGIGLHDNAREMKPRFIETREPLIADGRRTERDDPELLGRHAEISETRRRHEGGRTAETVPRQIEHFFRMLLELICQRFSRRPIAELRHLLRKERRHDEIVESLVDVRQISGVASGCNGSELRWTSAAKGNGRKAQIDLDILLVLRAGEAKHGDAPAVCKRLSRQMDTPLCGSRRCAAALEIPCRLLEPAAHEKSAVVGI